MASSYPSISTGAAAAGGPRPWLAPLVLFSASLTLYAVNLNDKAPGHDELYHVLAARGLLETGEPRIAEGLYTRGLLFTRIVALFMGQLGDTMAAARLPSALAIAALVAALFLWLRQEAGHAAAWLGASLFAVSPIAIDLAQFVRFYALQNLLFFGACWCLYDALGVSRRATARVLALTAAVAMLVLAASFQATTLMGVVGLGLWSIGVVSIRWLRASTWPLGRKLASLLALIAGGVATVALAWWSGVLADLWRQYRATPLFAQALADDFWFYHAQLGLFYPTLWSLVGVCSLVALVRAPRPAALALTVFATSFLLNSFGGPKALRYLSYAMPFLFALWGMAIAALVPAAIAGGRELVSGLMRVVPAPRGWQQAVAGTLAIGAVLFLAAANPFWLRSASLLADVTVPPQQPEPRWEAVRGPLGARIADAAVVVVTDEVQFLYHFGRYDVQFSPSKLGEANIAGPQRDFARDRRTGRPVIGSPAALRQVIGCYPTGVFATLARRWGVETHVGRGAVQVVEAWADPIELPRGSGLVAFEWRHLEPADDSACGEVRALLLARSASP